jgi:hypothetical protein
MADDKKPKIDLKARLGKTQVGGAQAPVMSPTPMPPGVGGGVPVVPSASPSARPPGMSGPGIPAPPGVPVGPPPPFGGGGAAVSAPALDPSNPLAAVAAPYRAPQVVQAAPVQPARIEVDEVAVHEARKRAAKTGMVVAVLLGLAGVGVGFVAGGAHEQSNARDKSKNDAKQLADDLGKAKESLSKLADKMDEGVKTLQGNKFPAQLAGDLGGLNVAFDGSELAGRRFSGFPQDTTAMLVDFITSVQALNDRKELIQGLLTKLQKPLTEKMNAPAGQQVISLVAAVQKDPAGNPAVFLAPLSAPITFDTKDVKLPSEFTFADPGGGGNAKAPRYTGGDISKNPAAVPVVPKTFDKVCPSETAGATAQLTAQIGGFIRDIKGEGQVSAEIVTDTKAGLLERAEKLITALQKVQ